MNLSRLLLLVLVGGGALAYWQRERIAGYLADKTKDKITATLPSF